MLLFNLLEAAPKKSSRHSLPWKWLGSAVVVLALLIAVWPRESTVRFAGVEEKEVVISTFQRIGQELPAWEEWADDYSDAVGSGSMRAFVVTQSPVLIREQDSNIYISEAFFEADSVTQRNALAQSLAPIEQPKVPAEIAVGKRK